MPYAATACIADFIILFSLYF